MRCTQTLLATMRETPAEAEIVSHRLMLRAGLIRLLASGLYTWLPLGMRVLRKVEAIVREEMNAAGAQEVLMPAIQPAELWEESGRWNNFGPELLRLKDRHERDFCVGPTHEEVITDIARREVRSYKQLPINLYQIQTKFRDEIRPRYGVMRAREFIMKDAYSFDLDTDGLERSYLTMHDAYCRTFERLGLDYRVVDADSGAIGGARSQEFHVLADYGEDAIAFSAGGFAANVELVPCPDTSKARPEPGRSLATVDTPGVHTIAELAAFLGVPNHRRPDTALDRIGRIAALHLSQQRRRRPVGNPVKADQGRSTNAVRVVVEDLGHVLVPSANRSSYRFQCRGVMSQISQLAARLEFFSRQRSTRSAKVVSSITPESACSTWSQKSGKGESSGRLSRCILRPGDSGPSICLSTAPTVMSAAGWARK